MKAVIRTIHTEQWLPLPLEDVFSFFSNAENLEELTPEWVGFQILTPLPIQMRAGALIDYRIHLHGIPLKWRTEITKWDPPFSFVDEQLSGPYASWRHEHRFESTNNGTLVTDHIDYSIPFSWIPGASLIQKFFVQPDLDRIFSYRRDALNRHFKLPPA